MSSELPEWARLQIELRGIVRATVEKYREAYPKPLAGKADDACTILLPYLAYARWSGDRDVRDWLYSWRDAYIAAGSDESLGFYHGFSVEGEAHHQWEDQSRFLSRLWFLDGDDPANASAVDDAAEHIGNWSPDVPAWYDWDRHDFVSYWFGTKEVANRGGYGGPIWGEAQVSPPTGIYREALYRVAQTCLNAYFATKNERYLAWVLDFLGEYVARLNRLGSDEDLVRIFAIQGWPTPDQTEYFTTQGWPHPDNRFVYGRYVPSLLTDLYAITGEKRFGDAARRFIDFCFPNILNFWHQTYFFGPYLRYRLVTGDTRHDSEILAAMEGMPPWDPEGYPFDVNGVAALGYSRWRGPNAEATKYWLTGDERHATNALRQAVGIGKVLLRRDASEFVEGFATAHIGTIVDQFLVNPLLSLSGWRPTHAAHGIDILDIGVDGGLPEGIALLRTPGPLDRREATIVNSTTTEAKLTLYAGGYRGSLGATQTILVPAGGKTTVDSLP